VPPLRTQTLEVCSGPGAIEVVEVGVLAARRVVHRFDRLTGRTQAEPDALDLGQMTDQAEQGQVRRRKRSLDELLAAQAGADVEQRAALLARTDRPLAPSTTTGP